MRPFILCFCVLAGCVSAPLPDACPKCGYKFAQAESEAKSKVKTDNGGWVYVITNPRSFGRGVYKIGMTTRHDPEKRISELYGTSVPFPFKAVYLLKTDSPRELEAFFHHALDTARLTKQREFFRLSSDELKRALLEARTVCPYRLSR